MAATLSTGVLCVSVDSADIHSRSSGVADRRAEIVELLQQFRMPCNWTLGNPQQLLHLPERAEITARIPSDVTGRGELVRLLRQFNVALATGGQSLTTIAADPYQTKTHWDVLVRQGCVAARPRLSNPTSFTTPQAVRGGLWNLPIHCSFGGGAEKTIRSQFGICRRRLIATANGRGLFHLIVDVGNTRASWRDELEALRALLRTATVQHRLGALRFVTLGELPTLLANHRTTTPLTSILRPAA